MATKTTNLELNLPEGTDNVDVSVLNENFQTLDADFPFKLGIDSDGNYGYYKTGADTITPFKSGSNLYSNSTYGTLSDQIDTSEFTKIYNTSVAFGSNGAKVNTNLAIQDEDTLTTNMSGGWNSSNSACYNSENLIGAYGGFTSDNIISVKGAKFWIGRYSGQGTTLTVTVEYLDASGQWNEIEDLSITTTLDYPTNIFTVFIPDDVDVYGVRWIHKKTPNKSSGNNITFFGMTLYSNSDTFPIYKPTATGLIVPPDGYDGFAKLYIGG